MSSPGPGPLPSSDPMAFLFPLSTQLVLPENFREDPDFREILAFLREHGFNGVELNIRDPLTANFREIMEFLETYALTLTMFASGLSAKELDLSLSHPDKLVRERSVDWCATVLERLAGTGAGFIAGFIKGGPGLDLKKAEDHFRDSLEKLAPIADTCGVDLLVEATNRYESTVANSLDEAAKLIQDLGTGRVIILPDTFHMNIEEADMLGSLVKYADLYRSIHLSDNNRLFPGHGAIDFNRVIGFLEEIRFTGVLAIEGNIRDGFIEDMTQSVQYMENLPR